MESKRFFTGNDVGFSIEEFLKDLKARVSNNWRFWIEFYLKDEAMVWYNSLDYSKMKALSDEDFEKVILDKWSHNLKEIQDKLKEAK